MTPRPYDANHQNAHRAAAQAAARKQIEADEVAEETQAADKRAGDNRSAADNHARNEKVSADKASDNNHWRQQAMAAEDLAKRHAINPPRDVMHELTTEVLGSVGSIAMRLANPLSLAGAGAFGFGAAIGGEGAMKALGELSQHASRALTGALPDAPGFRPLTAPAGIRM